MKSVSPWLMAVYAGVVLGWAGCQVAAFRGWTRFVTEPGWAVTAALAAAGLLAACVAVLGRIRGGGEPRAIARSLAPLVLLAGIPLAPLLGKPWAYPGTWEWSTWDYYALTCIGAAAVVMAVGAALVVALRPRGAQDEGTRPWLSLGAALVMAHAGAVGAAWWLPGHGGPPDGHPAAEVVDPGPPAAWIQAGDGVERVWAEVRSQLTGRVYGTAAYGFEGRGSVTVDLASRGGGAASALAFHASDTAPEQPRYAMAPLGIWHRDSCSANVAVRYLDAAGAPVGDDAVSLALDVERGWRGEIPAAAAGGSAEIEVDPGVGCEVLLHRIWAGAPEPKPRRVVLISLDTHASQHMNLGGREVGLDTSPTLNALVRDDPRAVGFPRGIAAADWTLPTHSSVWTGLYPTQHGMVQHAPVVAFDERLATLPELARDGAGVRTASLVSHMRLGAPFGFGRGVEQLTSYEQELGPRGRAVVEDALTLLEAHRDDDLLLFVHFFDAHSPYTNMPDGAEALTDIDAAYPAHIYDSDLYHRVVVGEGGRDPRKREENRRKFQRRFGPHMEPARAAYQLGIRDVDDRLGELFDGMRAAGIWDDTTVVIFADHGEEFFDHGLLTHTSLYRENIEVPVIVKVAAGSPWEQAAAQGEPFRDHAFEAHTTVYRVVLDALEVPVPQEVVTAGTGGLGLDALLALDGDRTAVSELYDLPNSGLYQVSVVEGPLHAIVTTTLDEPGRWTARDTFQEVYDDTEDPDEQRNLMGIKAEMAGQFLPGDAQQRAQQLREVSYRSHEARELTDEERAMLRALGYLE